MKIDFTRMEINPRHFLARSIVGGVVAVLVRMRGIVVIPFMTAWWTPEDLGIFRLLFLTASFLTPVLSLSAWNGLRLTCNHFTEKEKIRRAFYTSLYISGLSLLVSIFLVLFLGARILPHDASPYIYVACALIVVLNLKHFAVVLPYMFQRTRIRVFLTLAFEYGTFFVSLFLIYRGYDATHVAYGFIVVLGTVSLFVYSLIALDIGLPSWPDWDLGRRILKGALPMIPVPMLVLGVQFSDMFFVTYFHGSNEMGVYSIVISLCSLVMSYEFVLGFSYTSTLTKLWSDGNKTAFQKYASTTFHWSMLSLSLIVVYYLLYSDLLLRMFVQKKEFLPNVQVFWMMGAGFAFAVLSSICYMMFYSSQKAKISLTILLLTLCANTILNFLLIPAYGYAGAALASLLSYTLSLLLIMRMVRRVLSIQLFTSQFLRVISAAILCWLLSWACIHFLHIRGWVLFAMVPVTTLIYVVCLYVLKAYKQEEWLWFRQNIPVVLKRIAGIQTTTKSH